MNTSKYNNIFSNPYYNIYSDINEKRKSQKVSQQKLKIYN